MLRIYETKGSGLGEIKEIGAKGSWICLLNPSKEERERVSAATGVPLDFLEYPLDEEEIPRIETDDKAVLVIAKIPVMRGEAYDTIPLGVVITEDIVITVCLENNAVIDELCAGRIKGFYTFKRTRFLLYLLYHTALLYLRYLRQIDKRSEAIRAELQRSTRNEELIRLLDLGKSLVYFTTSLRANGIVMEKLMKSRLHKSSELEKHVKIIKMYEEDEDLLEDVIIENKQAIEMGDVYTSILHSTMDAFASVISNNLNMIIKFLTAATIILAIPTLVASVYGMNVPLPWQNSPFAFAGTLAASGLFSLAAAWYFRKRHMF